MGENSKTELRIPTACNIFLCVEVVDFFLGHRERTKYLLCNGDAKSLENYLFCMLPVAPPRKEFESAERLTMKIDR